MRSNRFFLSVFLLGVIFFSLLLFVNKNSPKEKSLQKLTSLTKLPGLALSNSFLEPRVIDYQDNSNRLYPGMQNSQHWTYVYAE